MATSIPPHNLNEICDCADPSDRRAGRFDRSATGNLPWPRFSHRRNHHGAQRDSPSLSHRPQHDYAAGSREVEEHGKNRFRIVVWKCRFSKIATRSKRKSPSKSADDKIDGISAGRNESDLKEPVRLVYELKRDADPDVVLNQLYQFSPLQDTFSIIFLALVDGKPRVMSFKGLLEEFLRHRAAVIRRRTQFLLSKARQRKHTVEGLLLAYANIDEIIRIIRSSNNASGGQGAIDGRRSPGLDDAASIGRCGLHGFPARARRARHLYAHGRASRRDFENDARPIGQSGTRKTWRRTHRNCSKRLPNISEFFPTRKTFARSFARLPGIEAQIRRRAAARKSAARKSARSIWKI